jgi:hypothetical protein
VAGMTDILDYVNKEPMKIRGLQEEKEDVLS